MRYLTITLTLLLALTISLGNRSQAAAGEIHDKLSAESTI